MIHFVKEKRYVVLKVSDLNEALTAEEKGLLRELINKAAIHREKSGKDKLECVVVESDWPIYEQVWELVKSIS